MTPCAPYRLGYKQKEDPRDARYPLAALMGAPVSIPVSKAWLPGGVLDQKQTSSCVGHACYQLLSSEPVLQEVLLSPMDIYDEARRIDEWADNDDVDEGTSIRAGLNVLRRHGLIQEYYWADGVVQAPEYMLKFGPLVFGTDWTEGMFEPDARGIIRPTGRSAGGHAWFAYACHWQDRYITGMSSWGPDWGIGGSFKISLYDLEELFKRGGTAAAVIEA